MAEAVKRLQGGDTRTSPKSLLITLLAYYYLFTPEMVRHSRYARRKRLKLNRINIGFSGMVS
ncbi:MAG: hypothetical protein ACP5TI_01930, partial [Thermoprotei archaeon]